MPILTLHRLAERLHPSHLDPRRAARALFEARPGKPAQHARAVGQVQRGKDQQQPGQKGRIAAAKSAEKRGRGHQGEIADHRQDEKPPAEERERQDVDQKEGRGERDRLQLAGEHGLLAAPAAVAEHLPEIGAIAWALAAIDGQLRVVHQQEPLVQQAVHQLVFLVGIEPGVEPAMREKDLAPKTQVAKDQLAVAARPRRAALSIAVPHPSPAGRRGEGNADRPLQRRVGLRSKRRPAGCGDPGVPVVAGRDLEKTGSDQRIVVKEEQQLACGLGRRQVPLGARLGAPGDQHLEKIGGVAGLGDAGQRPHLAPRLDRDDDGNLRQSHEACGFNRLNVFLGPAQIFSVAKGFTSRSCAGRRGTGSPPDSRRWWPRSRPPRGSPPGAPPSRG